MLSPSNPVRNVGFDLVRVVLPTETPCPAAWPWDRVLSVTVPVKGSGEPSSSGAWNSGPWLPVSNDPVRGDAVPTLATDCDAAWAGMLVSDSAARTSVGAATAPMRARLARDRDMRVLSRWGQPRVRPRARRALESLAGPDRSGADRPRISASPGAGSSSRATVPPEDSPWAQTPGQDPRRARRRTNRAARRVRA